MLLLSSVFLCPSAGLCAAKLLRASGLNPVVLEARDRVGGRTFTVQVKAGDAAVLRSVNLFSLNVSDPAGNMWFIKERFGETAELLLAPFSLRNI